MKYPTIWPHFFTATILNWKHLLKDDEYKDMVIECLKFLVDEKRMELNAFTIMSNHLFLYDESEEHSLPLVEAQAAATLCWRTL